MILLSGNSALRSEREVAAQDSVQAPSEQLPVRELSDAALFRYRLPQRTGNVCCGFFCSSFFALKKPVKHFKIITFD